VELVCKSLSKYSVAAINSKTLLSKICAKNPQKLFFSQQKSWQKADKKVDKKPYEQ
jgi:hypothetical protein